MIKFYQYVKDYAKDAWIHRDTATKRIKNWTVQLIRIPKGVKYYIIDKEDIAREHFSNLNK